MLKTYHHYNTNKLTEFDCKTSWKDVAYDTKGGTKTEVAHEPAKW
jgi:hypothetical protein